MRLYANENFPLPCVQRLRELGHDVLTTQEAGCAGQAEPDRDVLLRASSAARVLVTLNRRHFIALHLDRVSHAGIIVCSFDPDFAGLAQRIHRCLQTADDWTRRLERINREQTPDSSSAAHSQ
jgi:hypothetical protein